MARRRIHPSTPAGRGASALLSVSFAAFGTATSIAQTSEDPTLVVIEAPSDGAALGTELVLEGEALSGRRISTSDAATLVPGADAEQAGALSGRPSLHGFADDRLRTLVDGVPIASACPMHMNPPLSYADTSRLWRVDVLPDIPPVSLGGDSIGGTILVESDPPAFASAGTSSLRAGGVSTYYRSNEAAATESAMATFATQDSSFRYEGTHSKAGDYEDRAGTRIRASGYDSSNQQIAVAWRSAREILEVYARLQQMPYQGFANADMDMTGNVGEFLSARFRGTYERATVSLSGYVDHVRHQMNGNDPDRYSPSPVDITSMGIMPTLERGTDFGYRATVALGALGGVLRIGNELQVQNLDDRWPGAPVGMAFDFLNLNDARRTRSGAYAEWETTWPSAWTTLMGIRADTVWMNTGPVYGYDGVDADARAFDAEPRSRTDVNLDATLLARYRPDDRLDLSLGIARKTRSPNLYERYAWSTSTIGMISWFGDGNGYTGNPQLAPETAHTVAAAATVRLAGASAPELRSGVHYSDVQNYIGVTTLCGPACSASPASQLEFVNHHARLYGADASASAALAEASYGELRLVASAGFTRGEDLSVHTGLYHMMPLHSSLALEDRIGRWSCSAELTAVVAKTQVDDVRGEPTTPGYTVTTIRAAYERGPMRIDLAATNLFNRDYASPLGGTWQSALYPPGYAGATFRPLPAPGRSIDAAISLRF
jgi:iron complex outermembrane recepter protein